jgi:hypothetical protein
MKSLIVTAGLIACATPGYTAETWSETWTCTHTSPIDNKPTITRSNAAKYGALSSRKSRKDHMDRCG